MSDIRIGNININDLILDPVILDNEGNLYTEVDGKRIQVGSLPDPVLEYDDDELPGGEESALQLPYPGRTIEKDGKQYYESRNGRLYDLELTHEEFERCNYIGNIK